MNILYDFLIVSYLSTNKLQGCMQELIKEIDNFAAGTYDRDSIKSLPVHSEVIESCNITYDSKNDDYLKIILYIPEGNKLDETMRIDYTDLVDATSSSKLGIKEVFGSTEPYKFAFTIFKIGSDLSKNQISELLTKNAEVKSFYVTEYVEIHIHVNENELKI